ncbi:MAG: CHAT domain-containing protein [Prevotella sp.]|nr:CHAT domain-containing protein [Prevotella sp.]
MNALKTCFTLVCLALSLTQSSAQSAWKGLAESPQAKALWNQAIDMHERGNYVQGARLLQQLREHVDSLCAKQGIDPAQLPDAAFRDYEKTVRSEGNEWVMLSHPGKIGAAADRLDTLISRRERLGLKGDFDRWRQGVLKLRGDQMAERSDNDDEAFEQACQLYSKCLDNYRQHDWSEGFQDTLNIHISWAQLCYRRQQYADALSHMEAVMDGYRDMDLTDEYLDRQADLAMCMARNGRADEAIELIDEAIENYENTQSHRYGELLRKKAKIMLLCQQGQNDIAVAQLYRDYFGRQRDYACQNFGQMTSEERALYWLRLRPFVADCYRLEGANPALLYDVTLFAKGLLLQLQTHEAADGTASKDGLASLSYTWRDIQSRLKGQQAAVEFVQYDMEDGQHMAAIVLEKSGLPRWVAMSSPSDVMNLRVGVGIGKSVEQMLTTDNANAKNVLFNNAKLRQTLWTSDLLEALKNDTTIYFSPDGYQHLMPIEYLQPEEAPHKHLWRLTSTRRLMEPRRPVSIEAMLIYGGIVYDEEADNEHPGNDSVTYDYVYNRGNGSLDPVNFLDWSVTETQQIYELRHCEKDRLLTGVDATEQSFVEQAGRFDAVFFSTHGEFSAANVAQGSDLKPCLTDESLSQAFLYMAGCEVAVGDGRHRDHSMREGLLSARELGSTDLSHVKLLITSACQTGLGFLTSEGVYGLQRGIKNAGVGNMVLSLWSVADVSTIQLFVPLFQNLQAGMTLRSAFEKAQHQMATLTDENGENQFSAPYYNYPFILIDALE